MVRWLIPGALSALLIVSCGPEGSQSTDTDTDTDTDGSDSSGDMTAVSMTATTNPTSVTGMMTTGGPTTDPPPTETAEVTGPADTGETDGCPPGTQGCPCDVGSSCVDDLVCVEGVCEESAPCEDTDDEPNDDVESATMLADAVCNGDPGMGAGVLAGVDLDFYSFTEAPLGVCIGVEPNVSTDGDDDLDVCLFLDCAGQEVGTVDCGNQETADLDGLPGCCGTNRASFTAHSCGIGGLGGMDYIVRVGPGVQGQCTAYDLEYRIN